LVLSVDVLYILPFLDVKELDPQEKIVHIKGPL